VIGYFGYTASFATASTWTNYMVANFAIQESFPGISLSMHPVSAACLLTSQYQPCFPLHITRSLTATSPLTPHLMRTCPLLLASGDELVQQLSLQETPLGLERERERELELERAVPLVLYLSVPSP
jgi:hypothetical protein